MVTRSMRAVALAAGAALSALVLAGCSGPADGGGDETDAPVKLQVQTGLASGSAQLDVFTKLADEFTEKNPEITFELVPASASYSQTIKVMLAGKQPPDIWQTGGWSRDLYAKFLAPLQDESWSKDVNPALDASMREKDGTIYAIPLYTDIAGLLYNGDVLEKAGVDPDSLTTWKAFNAALPKIAALGITPIEASAKENAAGRLIDWLAPGFYTSKQIQSLQDGDFDAATYEPMLEQLSSWAEAGYINPDYSSVASTDAHKAFGAGQAAFIFGPSVAAVNALATSPDADLGYIPVPSNSGDPYLLGGEGVAYGASNTGPNVSAAKKFLAFLAEPKNQEAFASVSGQAPGLMTATSDLGKLDASYQKWVVTEQTPLEPYFDRVALPSGMWPTVIATADSVLNQQSTPAEAAQQVGKDFDSLYGQNE